MKKVCVLLLAFLLLTGCGEKNQLEGFWMSEDGETLTFAMDGQALLNGNAICYSVFDEDKILLSHPTAGAFYEAQFTIKNGVLTIVQLGTGVTSVYYSNENKQNEIMAAISLEQAEIQKQEEEAERQKEYEEHVQYLWDTYSYLLEEIGYCESRIGNLQASFDLKESDRKMYEATGTLTDYRLKDILDRQEEYMRQIEEEKAIITELQNEIVLILEELTELGEIEG